MVMSAEMKTRKPKAMSKKKNSRHRNPEDEAGVKIELDLGRTRDDVFTIVNPEDFMEGGYGERHGQKYTDLFLFHFGAYGWTALLVWEPSGLEDALEKAAAWLADYAPGHIMPQGGEELQELYKEAAEKLGFPWPLESDDEKRWEKVDEIATVDLTYTESGYLTSYEWTVNQLGIRDPIYLAAFEASLDKQRDQLDEDDEERAQKILELIKQPKKNPKSSRSPKVKKLEWAWIWPVMGSHVPSNRHYEADAPLGSMSGTLHLYPTHDEWKVYWETDDPYIMKLEGEGYHSIGRVPTVAEGKRMAKAWYDKATERLLDKDPRPPARPALDWPAKGDRVRAKDRIYRQQGGKDYFPVTIQKGQLGTVIHVDQYIRQIMVRFDAPEGNVIQWTGRDATELFSRDVDIVRDVQVHRVKNLAHLVANGGR